MRTLPTLYNDWAIVASFYCVIHYAMHYFHSNLPTYDDRRNLPLIPAPYGGWLRGHPHRKALVKRYLVGLFRDYEYLEVLARKARYHELDMAHITDKDLADISKTVSEFERISRTR